jgi:hypothetical protein
VNKLNASLFSSLHAKERSFKSKERQKVEISLFEVAFTDAWPFAGGRELLESLAGEGIVEGRVGTIRS